MIKEKKLFFWTLEIVLIIIGIYYLLKMPHLFKPIFVMVSSIFMPLFVSGFLYYMFNPLIVYFEKFRINRIVSFGVSFLILILMIGLLFMNFIPKLVDQFLGLSQSIPLYTEEINQWISDISNSEMLYNLNVEEQLTKMNLTLTNLFNYTIIGVSSSFAVIISFVMNFFVLIFTVPFILFFMFKDGGSFLESVTILFPKSIREEVKVLLCDINDVLSSYITNTVIDALIITVLSFITFSIIGQPYPLLLAVFCGITNIIPFLGPFIGSVPALLVALFVSPWQVLYVGIGILIIQQLDANLIKPLLMGKSLKIHPLTIILLLIASGSLGGVMGMIICIPLYAVIKVLMINTKRIIQKLNE